LSPHWTKIHFYFFIKLLWLVRYTTLFPPCDSSCHSCTCGVHPRTTFFPPSHYVCHSCTCGAHPRAARPRHDLRLQKGATEFEPFTFPIPSSCTEFDAYRPSLQVQGYGPEPVVGRSIRKPQGISFSLYSSKPSHRNSPQHRISNCRPLIPKTKYQRVMKPNGR